jgi:hypothetical protein
MGRYGEIWGDLGSFVMSSPSLGTVRVTVRVRVRVRLRLRARVRLRLGVRVRG